MKTYDLELVATAKKLLQDLDGQEITRKEVLQLKRGSHFYEGDSMSVEKMVKIGALVKVREEIGYYHGDEEEIWKINGKVTKEIITPLFQDLLIKNGYTVTKEKTDLQEYHRFIYRVHVSAFDIFAKNEAKKKKEALQDKLEDLQKKMLEVQTQLNNLG